MLTDANVWSWTHLLAYWASSALLCSSNHFYPLGGGFSNGIMKAISSVTGKIVKLLVESTKSAACLGQIWAAFFPWTSTKPFPSFGYRVVGSEGTSGDTECWTGLHSLLTLCFFLQPSSKCPHILQWMHLIGFHSYSTCCLTKPFLSLENSMKSGKSLASGISIKSLAYRSCDLSIVYRLVLIGIPSRLPTLLRESIPQYFTSSPWSCTQIGRDSISSVFNSISWFQGLTTRGFLSK